MFTSAFRMAMTASTSTSYETEAATYFAAIVTAGSTITTANKAAVNAFIVGCKADGIWTAIKASCLLAGPDSLAGALVPLVGAAPTNNLFISGDYSRTTGLLGNGTTKYLNSNRNNNADPQDNQHLAVMVATANAFDINRGYIGAGVSDAGTSHIATDSAGDNMFVRSRSAVVGFFGSRAAVGFIGISRNASGSVSVRSGGSTSSSSLTSEAPLNRNISVFGRDLAAQTNGRLSFYSIGESLNLSLLDARLTAYMAALT